MKKIFTLFAALMMISLNAGAQALPFTAVEKGVASLAMAGAETFRVEESIQRLLNAYGVIGDAFVIPRKLHKMEYMVTNRIQRGLLPHKIGTEVKSSHTASFANLQEHFICQISGVVANNT